MAKLNERTFVGKKVLEGITLKGEATEAQKEASWAAWTQFLRPYVAREYEKLGWEVDEFTDDRWNGKFVHVRDSWAGLAMFEDIYYPPSLELRSNPFSSTKNRTISISIDPKDPLSASTKHQIANFMKQCASADSTADSTQSWRAIGNSREEVLDQLMQAFEDIDQEFYDELFPDGVDWDTPWSDYAQDCINHFNLKSKIKKQKDGTYKLTLKKEPSDLLADYATTIRENFKPTIQEEIQNQDGWGDTVQDALEPVFSNLEDLMYEVRNAVRGSYAVNGDTVEDLVQELRDRIAQLEEATDDIEFESHAITEKLVEPSKEDLKPIEDKFAELGLEIEKQGKTLFGNTHYQLRKELDHPVTSEDLGPIFDELCDLGTKDMPTTCNVGVHRDGNNIISAAVDVLKKQIPDEKVEESCEKEDNKLQEDAAMTDQERVKIFADYFDIEAEDCDYNAEDHTIESPVGDFYFGTYDEMVDRAIANESEMIDDMGLALFTPNFRDEIVSNPELYDIHWFAEYWDDYNATADEEDEISYGDDEEAAQLYADTFGDEAFAAAVEKLLDKEAVTREVIKWDGVAGILAAYDGNEEDLGHGLYAYRWN